MPTNAALAGAETTALNNGASTVLGYLSAVANTVYATATVLATPNFPVAAISVSGTSVNWLSVPRDATVMITDSTATVVRGYYRSRLDNSGSVTTANAIYVNEIGQGDSGLIPQDLRTAGIQVNDLITVFQRWDGWAILPRIVYGGIGSAQIFEDYNRTLNKENSFPGPATAITVKRASDAANGKPGAWAWRVDSGQAYATLRFDVVDVEWPTAGAVTYLWTPPASWTVTGGSLSTTTFTAQVPAQAGNYILKLVVSEANGGSTTRYIPIWMYDFVNYFPLPITERIIAKDRTSARVTMGLNNNVLASIPDGTLVCYWEEGTWNGSYIPSATRFYNGFVSRENRDMPAPGLRGVSLDIIGPALLLQAVNANSQYLTAVNGTPSDWQSLSKTLSYSDFIIYWIFSRRTTLGYVFDYVPLGPVSLNWQINAWDIPTGNVLQQCQNQAARVGANFGSDSAGQFVVARIPSLTTYATRGANIVTRDSLNASLYKGAPVVREVRPKVRRTRGEAFFWGGQIGVLPSPMLCDAPDTVPGQGPAEDVLQAQIVNGQLELNERTGMWWSIKNNPFTVTISIPNNRDVFEPAHMQFISLTVPAYLSPDGVGYTKNVVPLQVNKRYNNEGGYADVEIQAEFETAGLPGKYVQVPVPNTNLAGSYSSLPITSSLPPITSAYGPSSSFIPTRALAIDVFGGAWRALGTLADNMTLVDVGAPSLIRTSLFGQASRDDSHTVFDAVQDPFDATRVIVIGSYGIARLSNPFSGSASWTDLSVAPQTHYRFGYNFAFGSSITESMWGKIEGSVNVAGYFGWLELPDETFGSGAPLYYAYTTNNFSTINRTSTGITYNANASRNIAGLSLGQFASAVGNINVFVSFGNNFVRSVNGGASFSAYSYTVSHMTDTGGTINMPYSLPGGGNNAAYQNLICYEGNSGTTGYMHGKGAIETAITTNSGVGGNTARSIQSLTIDANYLVMVYGNDAYRSNDGGASWTRFINVQSGNRFNGVNGWPTNPGFYIFWNNAFMKVTTDNFATQVRPFMSVENRVWAAGFADFSEVYPSGGVHP